MAVYQDNLTGVPKEDLDETNLVPDFYLVTLAEEGEDNETGAFVLNFRIDGPTFKGAHKKVHLSNPGLAKTQEDGEKQLSRLRKWARRLGLITDADLGKPLAIDFAKAVGKPFVLEIEPPRVDKRTGEMGRFPQVAYLGVYPLDHDSITAAERARLGLPLLPGQVAPVAGAPVQAGRLGKAAAATAAAGVQSAPPAKKMYDASDV